MSTTVARPHNTYGPRAHYEGPNGEVIPRFILWALAGKPPIIFGDGQQTRDFTYVSETADILVRMATHTGCQGEVLNVCSGEETSILEIANLVLDIVGLDVAPVHRSGRPADVLRLWGDPTRLRQYLGVSPQISVREGLERSIEWFRDNVSTNEETLERLQVVNWEIEEPEEWLRKLSSDAP